VRAFAGLGVCAATPATSYATFEQMEEGPELGRRACGSSLFVPCRTGRGCAKLRPTPMRGGVFEATLYFDDLTTEVIADGKNI